MEKDKRTGWLKDLKVGDEVFVDSLTRYGDRQIGIVSRITPTGRISVESDCDRQYSPEGYNKNGLYPARLSEIKQETKDKIRERLIKKILTVLDNIDLYRLNLKVLELLLNYLERFENKEKTK